MSSSTSCFWLSRPAGALHQSRGRGRGASLARTQRGAICVLRLVSLSSLSQIPHSPCMSPPSFSFSAERGYLYWRHYYISGSPPWIFCQVRTHIVNGCVERGRKESKRYCCIRSVRVRGERKEGRERERKRARYIFCLFGVYWRPVGWDCFNHWIVNCLTLLPRISDFHVR